MRLRKVKCDAFRHFVDQTLEFDPDVTVLVGRNDTGKTCILRDFFRNFYGQWLFGTDTPRLPDLACEHQKFSLIWDVERGDQERVRAALGGCQRVDRLVTAFDGARADHWEYEINEGVRVNGFLRHRDLFPQPSYVYTAGPGGPRERLLPQCFAAQFRERGARGSELPTYPETSVPAESLLLRLAGFDSYTRRQPGPGADDPWSPSLPTPGPSVRELNQALGQVAEAVTGMLKRWWHEPEDLQFTISVVGSQEQNSYWVTSTVATSSGLVLQGAGIYWFISFILELLWLEATSSQRLLLFDEPGSPLHPGAQRAVLRMLTDAAARSGSQLVYSTHSPFMIDWSFPQRIRLFERNYITGRGSIKNKPYHPDSRLGGYWDPLRSVIGITLGDIALIGARNVFVEGVTDQMIIANASENARSRGANHLDLLETSIVPYGDFTCLNRLLGTAQQHGARSVALIDADRQGTEAEKVFARAGVETIRFDQFADCGAGEAAIEDVIGIDDYTRFVNAYYKQYEWFVPLDVAWIRAHRGRTSLGRYLEDEFKSRGASFQKATIAPLIASHMSALSAETTSRLDRLVTEIGQRLGRMESLELGGKAKERRS